MSKRSQIMRAGYNWYPEDAAFYHKPLNEEDHREFMEGWKQAEEDSELEEYEEMRALHERWEYLKSKYEGETE